MSTSKNGVRVFSELADYSERPNTPPCLICSHLISTGMDADTDEVGIITGSSCKAFPKGIPEVIFWEKFPHHTTKHPKQKNNIMFQSSKTIVLDGIKYKVGWKGALGDIV